MKTALQIALQAKLAKTVREHLRAHAPSLEKDHWRLIDIVFNVGGIKNLSHQRYLVGILLGLNADINVIVPGPIEQLSGGDFAGPNASQLRLQKAVKQ